MPTYMTQFSYTASASAALVKNPEDRGAAVAALMEKLGGRMLNTYYTFGEYDGVVIFEAPEDITAMARYPHRDRGRPSKGNQDKKAFFDGRGDASNAKSRRDDICSAERIRFHIVWGVISWKSLSGRGS